MPAAFCTDAVAVLGLSLGAKSLEPSAVSDGVRTWLGRFLRTTYEMERVEEWQRALFAIADQSLGGLNRLPVPLTASAADVRVALRSKALLDTEKTVGSVRIPGHADQRSGVMVITSSGMMPIRIPG